MTEENKEKLKNVVISSVVGALTFIAGCFCGKEMNKENKREETTKPTIKVDNKFDKKKYHHYKDGRKQN